MGTLYMDLAIGEEIDIGGKKVLVKRTGPDVSLLAGDETRLKIGESFEVQGAKVTVQKTGRKTRLQIIADSTIRITRTPQ